MKRISPNVPMTPASLKWGCTLYHSGDGCKFGGPEATAGMYLQVDKISLPSGVIIANVSEISIRLCIGGNSRLLMGLI